MENTIYVGKYIVPEDGVICLPQSKIKILTKYLTTESNELAIDDRLIFVIEDNNFWPIICKLNDTEAEKLVQVLVKALRWRRSKRFILQTTYEVMDEPLKKKGFWQKIVYRLWGLNC